jgi:hypothetical protein
VPILDARNVTAEQPSAFFDVALGHIFLRPQILQFFANDHRSSCSDQALNRVSPASHLRFFSYRLLAEPIGGMKPPERMLQVGSQRILTSIPQIRNASRSASQREVDCSDLLPEVSASWIDHPRSPMVISGSLSTHSR